MCFVPVEGKDETYRHVKRSFIHTIRADKEKLRQIAELLHIPASIASKWRPGKILIVNDAKHHRKKP
jgi:hypothetical protein